MTKKSIPNIISVFRIVVGGAMFATQAFSLAFYILYLLGSFSDFLDGYLARRWKCTSRVGAYLDSIGDLVFYPVLIIKVLPDFVKGRSWLIIWLFAIVLIRFASVIITLRKYKKVAFLHTLSNKFTGFILFLIPLSVCLVPLPVSGSFACAVATLASMEELGIHIRSNKLDLKLDLNVGSIFVRRK